MFNVLFMSVGRRVELLEAFRNAYRKLGLDGCIVGVDVDPLAPALQVVDKPYRVPPLSCATFEPLLIQICQREQINLVFPLSDPDVPVLARSRKEIEKTGARVAAVSTQAASLTADKWLTYRFFRRLGVNTPRTWLPAEFESSRASYPLFVKPRVGSAGKGTYKVQNTRELDFFLDYVPEPIVQEFIAGSEITNDVICDLEGDVMAVVSRRRIEVRWGEMAKGVTVSDPKISSACVQIAHELPAIGPITVQCIVKERRPYFTEINARLGGGVPLGIKAGVDSPAWLLGRAARLRVEIPPVGTYQLGLYLTRFDNSYYLTEGDRERMESHYL